jgi:lambda family phage portal protein
MAKWWPWGKSKGKVQKRFYAGAQIGRLTNDWITSSSSADAEIKTSLKRLRDRSRQLVRDNDHARNALRAMENNVVGQGVGMQAQVKMQRGGKLDQRVNDEIETKWSKWQRKENCHVAGTLSFQDVERLAISSWVESGEIFIRLIKQPMGVMKTPLALEIIEADLCDEGHNELLAGGSQIRMGVEINKWSRPVAYWFYTSHPGDDGYQSNGSKRSKVRVPANEIIHLFKQQRPGQTRGVPHFASAILKMHHMKGYEEAEVVKKRAVSALMGFITSPEDELPSDGVQAGDSVTQFEPGIFKKLAPGESVTVPSMGTDSSDFEVFTRTMLRSIGAGLGISYETLSRDYSQSNYSSTRQALLEDRDNYRVIQSWMIANLHQRVYEEFIELSVLSGELNFRGYEQNPDAFKACRWMPRGWSWVDPTKEVAAYKEAIKGGMLTLSEVIAQSGGDLEEVMRQRAREIELSEELGLKFDTDLANEIQAAAPQPQSGQGQSEDDDEGEDDGSGDV